MERGGLQAVGNSAGDRCRHDRSGRRDRARNSYPTPEPYDLGTGYNHLAITVDDIDQALADLSAIGVEPEKPPYHPGGREDLPLIAFVADPDGYRIELIDGGAFPMPQDAARP